MSAEPKQLTVPTAFLSRAIAHIESTGEPLLIARLPEYSSVLQAWPQHDGGYTLSVPWDDWEPPFRTWREYARYKEISDDDLMYEKGFDDDAQLDDEIDEFILIQMIDPSESAEAEAGYILGDLPEYVTEADAIPKIQQSLEDLDEDDISGLLDDLDVVISERGSRFPGDLGADEVVVSVPSMLALSILQYALDELGRGVRIEIGSN